ncbi:alpha-2,3-sialyltransferase [Campylobacter lari]|nr:alpha-2,3-sialyltransferase [Campylobacter lari]
MYEYCIKQDILNFYINYYDYVHPVEQLMYTLAEAICQNIEHFKSPKKLDIEDFIPDFKIIEIDKIDGKNERVVVKKRSYLYSKNILKIGDEQFYISEEFEGYNILGVHTWNEVLEDSKYSYLTLSNSKLKLSKFIRPFEAFSEIYTHNFTIDNKTSIFSNEIVEDLYKEEDILGYLEELNTQKLVKNTYTGLIGILLVKCDDKYLVKYNDIKKCNIVDEEFNCNYILSFMDNYKNFTEQYIKRTISYKDKNIQSKNQNCQIKLQDNILPFQAKYGTAKTRIQNQLSYKLGQAMIVNSKSILGYIRMPFVLSYIKDKHKQEQKIYQEKIKKDPSLALPPLESYPDYQEALRFKNHLSYKLGQALIQANKTWYGGGYIKLLFEIRKLKREFKQK